MVGAAGVWFHIARHFELEEQRIDLAWRQAGLHAQQVLLHVAFAQGVDDELLVGCEVGKQREFDAFTAYLVFSGCRNPP